MISGANEESLIIATARANIILKLNNTNEYKSWIILDNYIDKLEQENKQLKEQFDRMFAIYHSRKLIKKFNDEYDEEDKMKNPNRDYACVCPDAEEVYKRYYELKEQLQQKEDIINKAKEYIKNHKRNLIHEITHEEYEMLDEENIVNLLEILDNKGE